MAQATLTTKSGDMLPSGYLLLHSLTTQSQEAPPPMTRENVAYGDHPQQVIDFWQAKVEGPAH